MGQKARQRRGDAASDASDSRPSLPPDYNTHHKKSANGEFGSAPFAIVALAVTVAALAPYLGSINGDFVLDDLSAIVENPDVTSGRGRIWSSNFWGDELGSSSARHHSYRPLVVHTFRLNYIVHAKATGGYHAVNMALHALVSVVFLHSCQKIFIGPGWASAFAALLFAVHPIHADAVASLVGRCELMAALFFLLTLLCFAEYTRLSAESRTASGNRRYKGKKAGAGSSSAGTLHLAAALLCGWAALLSKEQGVTVFVVCSVYDLFVVHGGRWRECWQRCAAMLVVAACSIALRVSWNRGDVAVFDWQSNPAAHDSSSVSEKWLTQLHYVTLHFWKLLWPRVLACDYSGTSIPMLRGLDDARNVGSALFLCMVAGLGVWVWAPLLRGGGSSSSSTSTSTSGGGTAEAEDAQAPFRNRAALALACMAVPFLPASGFLLPVGFVVAERIMYLPSLGFCVLSALLLRRALDGARPARVICASGLTGVCLAAMAWRCWTASNAWLSLEGLYQNALFHLPNNAKLLHNVGHARMENEQLPEAAEYLARALELLPSYSTASINHGVVLAKLGRIDEASAVWRDALAIMDREPANAIMGNRETLVRNYARSLRDIGDHGKWEELRQKYPRLIQ